MNQDTDGPDWYWLQDLEYADPEYIAWLDQMDAIKRQEQNDEMDR